MLSPWQMAGALLDEEPTAYLETAQGVLVSPLASV